MIRVYYRIVDNASPGEDGFKSFTALGRRPRKPTPKALHEYDGVSVLVDQAVARQWAEERPWLGEYIAELHIPDEAPIAFEGPNARGHGNLYGATARELLSRVGAVYHISTVSLPATETPP